ncbi:ADP-ribosylglycohydrolase family protein [bacterium C-53]|nr:ADP-ribosylglycohydrolase family protein [Lachnospiraceae bacterium]NBI04012.1 ADP-ribosylglycohydrolase family protein [Lachnospiraceae bacterium]RKJ08796.1 ADP-ribosylglycohydrolase family protein [bacterium C-53]
MKDRVAGALYGMALGDAMGMPAELWSRERAKKFFGKKIDGFLDGPEESEVAFNYKYGQFTDDTGQALVLLDSIAATGFVPDAKDIAVRMLAWAEKENAWENNILGPTSKVALANFRDGIEDKKVTDKALSNGSAMRIPPIGCLFTPDQKQELVDYVYGVSRVTHTSNVTIAGAAMIAAGVSSAIVNDDFDKVIEDILDIEEAGYKKGFDHFTPRLKERTKLALEFAREYKDDEEMFSRKIYDVIGTGVCIIESVPAAVAAAYYTQDPDKAALLCANLGGDTDTIGAMAAAICGAFRGMSAIKPENIEILRRQNDVDFDAYIDILLRGRETMR